MSMEDEGMEDEHVQDEHGRWAWKMKACEMSMEDGHGRYVSYWPLHGLTSAEPMSFGDDHCL